MCQEFVSSFVGWFWLRVSHEAIVMMSARAVVSSEGFSGAGDPLPDVLLP